MVPVIDITNEEQVHYVAWSGGADSTLLLYSLCEALKKLNGKKPIALISEPWYFTTNKIISEAKARENIEKEFIARDLPFDKMVIKTSVDVPRGLWGHTGGLPQPALWLNQFLPVMQQNAVIHFGYITGDHFWFKDHEFEKILDSFNNMLDSNTVTEFDLMHLDKADVLKHLKEIDLYKYIWYCESPNKVGEPCGCCHPCETHRKALVNNMVNDVRDLKLLTKIIDEHSIEKDKLDKLEKECMKESLNDVSGEKVLDCDKTTI